MSYDGLVLSLERLAERDIDPGPDVYARMFAAHPETEPLFVRDVDGAVRGQMLQQAIECLLDLAGSRSFGRNLMATEIINHEGVGVPPDVFPQFFVLLRDSVREALGPDWTGEMDASWQAMLVEVGGVLRR
ncbi:MAG TPA: globin [Phenylobacterium sp.]